MTGLPLFDWAPPYQRDSETSREAAEHIEPVAGTLRAQVRRFIERRGAWGATRDEICASLNLTIQSVTPRVNELLRDGHVIEPGQRRMTRAGRRAEVVIAVPQ